MKKCILSLIILGSVSLSWSAAADDGGKMTAKQQAAYDALIEDAVELYSAREYEASVEKFKQAFDIQAEPELVYNIARCYERLADSEEALEWYQKFLEMPGTTGDLRTRALTNISALKREIAAKEAVMEADQSSDGSAAGTTGNGNGNGDEANAAGHGGDAADQSGDGMSTETGTPGSAPADKGTKAPMHPMKIAGWSLVGGGVAAVVVGSIFGGLAMASKNDYESVDYDPSRLGYRDDMKRNALIFDVVFSAGAVLTATGASLLIVHTLKNRSKNETAVRGRMKTDRYERGSSVTLGPTVFVGSDSVIGGFVGRF